jgi:TPR repeat protein
MKRVACGKHGRLWTADTIIYASISALRNLSAPEREQMVLQPIKPPTRSGASAEAVAAMSLDALRLAAAAGNPYAHRRLAEQYETGDGVSADLPLALFHHTIEARLFEQAGEERETLIVAARRGSDARALPPEIAVKVACQAMDWKPEP